jgi:hypothetical protein
MLHQLLQLPSAATRRVGRCYAGALARRESDRQVFRRHNERPVELRFVFDAVTRLCPEVVLDVGTGDSSLPALLRNCGCVVRADHCSKVG